jgi:hypothetical protein
MWLLTIFQEKQMITRSMLIISCVLTACSAYASMDVDMDMDATNRVMGMIVDLGGQGAMENNGRTVPCVYRGTRKVSITRRGEITTYSG